MVVPTPVLVSTALSHCDFALVIVKVMDCVPLEIVTTGAAAQVVEVVDDAVTRVMFVAD
jgi:hypothetical protein